MPVVPELPYDAVQRIELDAAPLAVVARTGLRVSALPSGAAFAATHVGGYEGLGAAWGGVVAAAAAQGAQPAGVWIEVYVTDPSDTAEDALRTDLVMPVAG